MAKCRYTYNGKTYSEEAFKTLLANGELEQLKKESKYNFKYGVAEGRIIGAIEQRAEGKKELKQQATEFKEQLKKDIKEGKEQKENIVGLVSDFIKATIPSTGIPASDTERIVKASMKVTTEAQLDKFIRAYGNIVDKQEAKNKKAEEENIVNEKKSVAKKNKGKIKKVAKSDKTFANDKPILKEFGRINPNQVEDIDEYNRIAEQLLDKQNRTISNKEVEAYVEKQKKTIEEKLRLELLDANIDLVGTTINDKMSLQEMREALEGYKTIVDGEMTKEEKLEERKKRGKEQRDKLQSTIDEKLIQLNEELKGQELSERQTEVIDALNNIDRTDLKDETLQLINRVIDNIIVNDSFAKTGDLLIVYRVQEAINELGFQVNELGYESLEEFIDDSAKGFEKFFNSFKQLQSKILSPTQLMSAMEKYNALSGLTAKITGIQDLYSGHSQVIKRMKQFDTEFNKKQNKNNRGFFSQIRQAMYSMVSQNYGGTQEDIDADFQTNKARLNESAKRTVIDVIDKIFTKYSGTKKKKRITIKERQELIDKINNAENLSDVLDEIKERFPLSEYKSADFSEADMYVDLIENSNNADEVWNKLTEDEKEMITFLRDEFNSLQEDLFETAEMYDNEVPEFVNNYLPLIYNKMVGKSKIKTDKTITEDITSNSFMGGLINKSPSGTTINRNKGQGIKEGMRLSTNFHYDMNRKFREALYQIHTLGARKTIDRVLGNEDFQKIFGRQNADMLHKYISNGVKTQLNLTETDPSWIGFSGFLSKLGMAGTRVALGSPLFGRAIQALPPMMRANLKGGKYGFSVWSMPKPNENLFKYSNIEEATITKAAFKQDYYQKDKELANELSKIKKWYKETTGAADDVANFLNDKIMSEVGRGDAIARQKTWMMYYKIYRKKRDKAKGFKWSDEYKNPSKSASAYADAEVQKTQSGNSFSNLAPILTKQRNWGDFVKSSYMGFMTFVINSRAKLSLDYRKLRKGIANADAKLMGEAIVDIVAAEAEFVTFASIKFGQSMLAIWMAQNALQWLTGMGDDEAEKVIPQLTFEDFIRRTAGSSIKGLFFDGIPLIDAPVNQMINLTYKSVTDDKRNLVYQKNTEESNWWDSFGTYSPAVGSWYNVYKDSRALIDGVPKLIKGGLESKSETGKRQLTQKESDVYTALMIFDTMKALGVSDQTFSSAANKIRKWAEDQYAIEEAKILFDPNKPKKEKTSGRGDSRVKSRLKGRKVGR